MPGYEAPNQAPGAGEHAQRNTFWSHLFPDSGGNVGNIDQGQVDRLIQEIEARLPPDKRNATWTNNDDFAREVNLPTKTVAALWKLRQIRDAHLDPNTANDGEKNRGIYNLLKTGYSDEYIDAYNDAVDYVSTASAEETAAREAQFAEGRRRDVNNQIQKFIDDMTGPSGPNDPVRMALIQGGTDAAQASAGSAGLSGRSGLAGTQAASIAQQNLLPYEAQRATLRQQGIGTLNQRDLTQQQLDDAWSAMELARADKLAEGRWAGEMNQRQGMGAAIGTGLGALGFIGGPAVGAATMSAGGALGAGLGGLGGASSPNYQQSLGSRGRRSGGGQGSGF